MKEQFNIENFNDLNLKDKMKYLNDIFKSLNLLSYNVKNNDIVFNQIDYVINLSNIFIKELNTFIKDKKTPSIVKSNFIKDHDIISDVGKAKSFLNIMKFNYVNSKTKDNLIFNNITKFETNLLKIKKCYSYDFLKISHQNNKKNKLLYQDMLFD